MFFSAPAKAHVDEMARKLHQHLRWQSDKALPRTSFPNGITNLTKLQGNERSGVLLLLLLILIMDYWAEWRSRGNKPKRTRALRAGEPGYLHHALTPERASNVVKSIYLLIIYEAHMKLTDVPLKDLKAIKDFMPVLMDQVLRTFHRAKGTGNNIIKNHLPLHYVDDITRHGSAPNFNSGVGESLHKAAIKKRKEDKHECG